MKILVLLTSVLGFIGLAIQFYFSIPRRLAQGHSIAYAVNYYFSYFTILTNTFIAILLFCYVLSPDSKLSLWFKKTSNNAAIALYIFIVSLIYYTLLLNNHPLEFYESMATHILHAIVPTAYLLLWFFRLRKGNLKYTDSLKWIAFPLVYFIYILIRGAIVDAYPYFFINVTKLGYPIVLLYAAGILLIFLIVGLSIVALDQKIKIKD